MSKECPEQNHCHAEGEKPNALAASAHAMAPADSAVNPISAKKPFAALGRSCAACHKKFRAN